MKAEAQMADAWKDIASTSSPHQSVHEGLWLVSLSVGCTGFASMSRKEGSAVLGFPGADFETAI